MGRLDADGHVPGAKQGLQRQQDLLGQPLLYLGTTGEELHDAVDLRQANHLAAGNVGYVGKAVYGDEVVLAGAGEVDVPHHDHLVHLHLVLDHRHLGEGGIVEAGEDLVHVHLGNAVRGLGQTVVGQIQSQRLHDGAHMTFDLFLFLLAAQFIGHQRCLKALGLERRPDQQGFLA